MKMLILLLIAIAHTEEVDKSFVRNEVLRAAWMNFDELKIYIDNYLGSLIHLEFTNEMFVYKSPDIDRQIDA